MNQANTTEAGYRDLSGAAISKLGVWFASTKGKSEGRDGIVSARSLHPLAKIVAVAKRDKPTVFIHGKVMIDSLIGLVRL
jgi:hypothetical protein